MIDTNIFQFPTKRTKAPPGSTTSVTRGSSGSTDTAPWPWTGRRAPTCPTAPSWTTTTWTSPCSWWTWARESLSMVSWCSHGRDRVKVHIIIVVKYFLLNFCSKLLGHGQNIDVCSAIYYPQLVVELAVIVTILTMSSYCRQDHLLHRLCLQPGQAQRLRVGQAGAGLRWTVHTTQVRRHHSQEHRPLQSSSSFRLS